MSPETCWADLKRLTDEKLLHLVGCLHRCTSDARSHKHQVLSPIFKGQAVHEAWTACPLKTALLRCLKMSQIELPVLPTSRNIPDERRPQLHRGRSLKSRMLYSAILQTLDLPAI